MPITPEQARAELARRELARRGISANSSNASGVTQNQPEQLNMFKQALKAAIPFSPMIPGLGAPSDMGQYYQERVSPVLSGASSATFGIPRFITDKMGVSDKVFPEQQTAEGKMLRFVSETGGLFGGGASKLATYAAEKLTPKMLAKVGMGIQQGVNSARQSAVLANRLTKGAIQGSVFGGTQLVSGGDSSLSGQALQAVGGGIVGAAFPLTGNIIDKTSRGLRKFRSPTRTNPAGALTKSAKENAENKINTLRQEAQVKIGEIDNSIDNTKQLKTQEKFTNKIDFTKRLSDTKQQLDENVQTLNRALDVKTEDVALRIQKKLPEFYRSNSTAFGKRLDEISDALVERGEGITIGEVDNMLENIIKELDDSLIIDGSPRVAIEALKNKYSLRFIAQPSRFGAASSGLPPQSINANIDEVVPLKNLYNDIKNIRKSLSGGAKSGSSRFTQEDVAVSIFNKEFAGMLGEKVPELQQLRASYKPIIDAMKVSNKIFKPFNGEFNIKTGANLLKRASLQKTNIGENALINAIENGSEFAPGIGKITPELIEDGLKLKEAKSRISGILEDLRMANTLKNRDIDVKFVSQINELTRQRSFIEASSKVREELIANQLKKRLEEIGVRKDIVENLTKDKQKMMTFIRTSLFISAAAGSAAYGISRMTGQQSQYGGR